MLKKLSERLGAKFPATTSGCSMLKITGLDDAFSKVFNCKQAQYPGGGGTPIYGLHRYVPRIRVWFSKFSVLK